MRRGKPPAPRTAHNPIQPSPACTIDALPCKPTRHDATDVCAPKAAGISARALRPSGRFLAGQGRADILRRGGGEGAVELRAATGDSDAPPRPRAAPSSAWTSPQLWPIWSIPGRMWPMWSKSGTLGRLRPNVVQIRRNFRPDRARLGQTIAQLRFRSPPNLDQLRRKPGAPSAECCRSWPANPHNFGRMAESGQLKAPIGQIRSLSVAFGPNWTRLGPNAGPSPHRFGR